MKHGVLIDREYYERLEVFIRLLSDMGLVSSSVTTPVLKGMEIAISSAPDAVKVLYNHRMVIGVEAWKKGEIITKE